MCCPFLNSADFFIINSLCLSLRRSPPLSHSILAQATCQKGHWPTHKGPCKEKAKTGAEIRSLPSRLAALNVASSQPIPRIGEPSISSFYTGDTHFGNSTSQYATALHASTGAGTNKSRSKPQQIALLKSAELKPGPDASEAGKGIFEMLKQRFVVLKPANLDGCNDPDSKRLKMVEALSGPVGNLASLLKDSVNEDRGPASRMGLKDVVLVECCDLFLEKLVGGPARMCSPRKVTLHYFVERQLKRYIEEHKEQTGAPYPKDLHDMVFESLKRLPKRMDNVNVTPLVFV